MKRRCGSFINATGLALGFLILTLALGACKGVPVRPESMNAQAKDLLNEANLLLKEGKQEEAAKLMRLLQGLHPNDPQLKSLLAGISPERLEAVTPSPWLGFNKATRAKVEASTLTKVLLYLPDRILDFIDQVTVYVSAGVQLGAGVWVTRAVQVVAFTGSTVGLGYGQKKMLGGRVETSNELVIGPVGAAYIAGARAGTGGIDSTAGAIFLHKPSHKLYQEYRDYWGVGAKAGFVILGFEVEYHPVEIFDFLAGLILYDPLNDDLATTRRLRYSDKQEKLMDGLLEMMKASGEEGVKEYQSKFPNVAAEPSSEKK